VLIIRVDAPLVFGNTEMIKEIITDLREQEIELKLAEASGQVRDVLQKAGIEAMIGKLGRSTTIHAVIEEWQNAKALV